MPNERKTMGFPSRINTVTQNSDKHLEITQPNKPKQHNDLPK